jgi:hypothetical protein
MHLRRFSQIQNLLKMTIPFYTGDLKEPLNSLLSKADNDGNFQPVLDFCEPLIGTTEDDGVILCYTFGLMEQAMVIHIDDVTSTAENCLVLLKRLKHEYGGTDHWRRMLRRMIKEDKNRKKEENDLGKLDYKTLNYPQKSKLAYNLQDKNTIESITKACAIHKELINHPDNNLNSHYHLGQYILCLYELNQKELADKVFDDFSIKMKEQPTHGYAFLVTTCYQQKLLSYADDGTALQKIWNEAINHPVIRLENGFPYSDIAQDKILMAADKFNLTEIINWISKLIKQERKPRMISEEIKLIIGM